MTHKLIILRFLSKSVMSLSLVYQPSIMTNKFSVMLSPCSTKTTKSNP